MARKTTLTKNFIVQRAGYTLDGYRQAGVEVVEQPVDADGHCALCGAGLAQEGPRGEWWHPEGDCEDIRLCVPPKDKRRG